MISKQDILERAREWQLRPEVVEKDYVLGWVLAAIAQHEETSSGWVLKGGTCVKKCFFETYRFSEDLDFTLLPDAAYAEEDLRETLQEISEAAHELSGIEFSAEALAVRSRVDKLGRVTFEGKIGYRGPLGVPTWPRVLFDLTQHEPVIDEPVLRRILHPYPDKLPEDAAVQTYSIEELIAEKTRALYERSRPRDLYDVVYVLDNSASAIQLDHAREVFEEKCQAKQFTPPTSAQLFATVDNAAEVKAEWENMLGHQLPSLPPADGMLVRLRDLLGWLDRVAVTAVSALPVLSARAEESIVAPAETRLWGAGVPLEALRFAGANRLLVRFVYTGKARTLEPYSLRRSSRGNLLLYGWEIESGQIKAFDVGKIAQLSTTDRTFVPRYQVEFTATGTIDTYIPVSRSAVGRRTSRSRARRQVTSGPTYVFTCPVCQKEFRHRRNDPKLRRHKMRDSTWYCSGRRGYLTRME